MAGKTLMYIIPTLMAAATAAPHEARKIETGETVYAYGMGGITGYPVYADFDGMVFVAVVFRIIS